MTSPWPQRSSDDTESPHQFTNEIVQVPQYLVSRREGVSVRDSCNEALGLILEVVEQIESEIPNFDWSRIPLSSASGFQAVDNLVRLSGTFLEMTPVVRNTIAHIHDIGQYKGRPPTREEAVTALKFVWNPSYGTLVLSERINALEGSVNDLRNDILSERINALEGSVNDLRNDMNQLRDYVRELRDSMRDLEPKPTRNIQERIFTFNFPS